MDRPDVVGVGVDGAPARRRAAWRSGRTPRARTRACRARTRCAGGRGRARAASAPGGRAGWRRRRGRSRAGARTSGRAGRSASARAARRGARAAPCQSPATQARDGGGVGLLALVAARRRPAPRGRCAADVEVGGVGAHEVEVGDEGVGHRRRRRRAGELGGEVDDLGVVAQQAVDGPVVQGDRRRRRRSSGCRGVGSWRWSHGASSSPSAVDRDRVGVSRTSRRECRQLDRPADVALGPVRAPRPVRTELVRWRPRSGCMLADLLDRGPDAVGHGGRARSALDPVGAGPAAEPEGLAAAARRGRRARPRPARPGRGRGRRGPRRCRAAAR